MRDKGKMSSLPEGGDGVRVLVFVLSSVLFMHGEVFLLCFFYLHKCFVLQQE